MGLNRSKYIDDARNECERLGIDHETALDCVDEIAENVSFYGHDFTNGSDAARAWLKMQERLPNARA